MSVASVVRTERLEIEYLDSLSQRIRAWRFREGKSYFSMPTALWDEAIAAARKYGLRSASKMLGLNRDNLKRRMGLLPAIETDSPVTAVLAKVVPAAIETDELEVIELTGVAAALSPPQELQPRSPIEENTSISALTAGEAVIEIVGADGARLTVRLPVAQLDVPALVHRLEIRDTPEAEGASPGQLIQTLVATSTAMSPAATCDRLQLADGSGPTAARRHRPRTDCLRCAPSRSARSRSARHNRKRFTGHSIGTS